MKNKQWIGCTILFLFLISACSQDKVTVIFETDGGTTINNIEVSPGTKLPILPEPVKENYFFGGWYIDPSIKYRFDNYSRVINTDIVLYARWIDENDIQKKIQTILECTALIPYIECTITKEIKPCIGPIIKSSTDIQYDRLNKKISFNSTNSTNNTQESYYFDGTQGNVAYSSFSTESQTTKYRYTCSLDYLYGLSGLKQILEFSTGKVFDSSLPIIEPLDPNSKNYKIVYGSSIYEITFNDKKILEQVIFTNTERKIIWKFNYNLRSIDFPVGNTFSDFVSINSRRVTLFFTQANQAKLFITPRKGGFFRLTQEEADRFAPTFDSPYTYSHYNDTKESVFVNCSDYVVGYDNEVLYPKETFGVINSFNFAAIFFSDSIK